MKTALRSFGNLHLCFQLYRGSIYCGLYRGGIFNTPIILYPIKRGIEIAKRYSKLFNIPLEVGNLSAYYKSFKKVHKNKLQCRQD